MVSKPRKGVRSSRVVVLKCKCASEPPGWFVKMNQSHPQNFWYHCTFRGSLNILRLLDYSNKLLSRELVGNYIFTSWVWESPSQCALFCTEYNFFFTIRSRKMISLEFYFAQLCVSVWWWTFSYFKTQFACPLVFGKKKSLSVFAYLYFNTFICNSW
jgi:hypothetical protein